MNAALHAVNPRMKVAGGSARLSRTKAGMAVVAAIGVSILLYVALGRSEMSGRYAGADGTSLLEFRGDRVFVTTVLGTTFVTGYEVDGDRVIIKGAGGAQVYTRNGDTLDGGVGIRFVKQSGAGGGRRQDTQGTQAQEDHR